MKKIATLLLILTLSLPQLKAQTSGGPDAYGYIWRNSLDASGPVYNWIDILSLPGVSEVRFLADDNVKGSFPIGFPFHYYWYDVTQFWVGSNGYIGFTNGQISHPFPTIPMTTGVQDYLAIMESDLIFDDLNSAKCWRWTNAANDTLIVSFCDVPFWDPNPPGWVGTNTFQVILSAVDSSITYQYKIQTGAPANLVSYCSVGIENNSGVIGLQPSYNALPPINYAIKFSFPASTTYIVNDASTSLNNNPTTGGLFLSKNGAPFTMTTDVKNTGNQNLTPFNVFSRVINSVGTIQVQDNQLTGSLTPGQSQSMTMSTVYNPTTTLASETYRFVTNTQLAGDITPSNDQKIQELVVLDTTATNIRLSFDDGVEAGLGGLNWGGGVGGAATYFIPPFYPFKITDIYAYIAANPNFVGYAMEVYDDNGGTGAAGTRLDSIYTAPGSVFTPSWNTTTLTTPITVNSGGVYIAWEMSGLGLTLGQNQQPPFSNRTFEILSGSWADYRYRETEDLMINIGGTKVSTIGISENESANYFGDVYPNPSAHVAAIDYNFPKAIESLSYEVYDVQGKLIASKEINQQMTNGKLTINTEELPNGIYSCRIIVDGKSYSKKFSVMR